MPRLCHCLSTSLIKFRYYVNNLDIDIDPYRSQVGAGFEPSTE